MKILKYLLRELKNLFEFYLIPWLVVVLPHGVYYPIFKFICRYTFFYGKYSGGSYDIAHEFLRKEHHEKLWNRNVKLLYLVDISDYWLAKIRPKKMLKSLTRQGEWYNDKGHLALSLHWGSGYITLVDLKKYKFEPYFVFAEPQVAFKYQSLIEKIYRNARTRHINHISGSMAITTGGGYNKILQIVANKGIPVILYDAPQFDKESEYFLTVFGKKYKVASGFISLICKEKIKYQLFSVKCDFNTGERLIDIQQINQSDSVENLLGKLSKFFEELLLQSPEQWFFWRQSPNLFEEFDEEE
jgi:lauroyl/myristoyl acyltransferase